jgi:hypothetical protein
MSNDITAISGRLIDLASLKQILDTDQVGRILKITYYQSGAITNRLLQANSHGSFVVSSMTVCIPGDTEADSTVDSTI